MTELPADDLDSQARALIESWDTPKRRARPRVSRSLAEAEEHMIAVPSGEVATWRLGQGPAVLLVHGWEDDNALWGPLADQFTASARPVVAMDLPGHGFSTATDTSARGVSKAVREVAKALGPIEAVVGHSYGCLATIVALAQGLQVPRVVLIASPVPRTRQRRRPDDEYEVAPEVVDRAMELRAQGEEERREKLEEMLRSMTTPALIIHSIDDEQCPMENAERMAQLWPGAELLLVDGLGHRFVAQDGDVLQRTVDFCEGV